MSYIGNEPTSVAFLTDSFSGTGSQTAFTLSAAPANTSSILVAVSGVLQDPTTYSTTGTTLTFSAAPPSGTGNISVRFLGIPASGVTTTAYRTQTEFTATAGQTTFSVPSYTPGFIDVYRNGALLGSADFTATNGTTVVLANAASAGDLVETVSFFVSSVINAIPAVAGAVTDSYILSMAGSKLTGSQSIPKAALPAGSVLQVVSFTSTSTASTSSGSYVDLSDMSLSITPSSATSKVLVFGTIHAEMTGSDGGQIQIVRGSTAIGNGAGGMHRNFLSQGYGGVNGTNVQFMFLDSPSTTSSTTYKLQWRVSSGTAYFNRGVSLTNINDTSTITLMEIAA